MLKYQTLDLSNVLKNMLQQISTWFVLWHLWLKWLWYLIFPHGFNYCESHCESQNVRDKSRQIPMALLQFDYKRAMRKPIIIRKWTWSILPLIVSGSHGAYEEYSVNTKRCSVSGVGKNTILVTSGGSGTTVQCVPIIF